MNQEAINLLTSHLRPVLNVQERNNLNHMFSDGEEHCLFHPDLLRPFIQDALFKQGLSEEQVFEKTDKVIEDISNGLSHVGIIVLDHWTASISREVCQNCPAYEWVIHKEGKHNCRLGFEILEKKNGEIWTACPSRECIRPNSVGASYLIARELKRPEPMVGKLAEEQYRQMKKEENADKG